MWSHFKMDLVLPSQRNCLACVIPQTFGLLKLGKLALGLD